MLLAAAALGAVLVLVRQVSYGVGLHWDSGSYVGAARYLLAGDGFRDYAGAIYVGSPPLYPLLLAVLSFDVLDPLKVAGPVNAALFGLTVFVVGRYLRRRLESRFLVVWATLAVALAWPLAGQAAIALAGATFILLVTLTLINTDAYLADGRTSSLVWAGVCAALAWQTHYLGTALLAAVVIMLLAERGPRPAPRAQPAQRVRRAAGFALLAGAPMALWLVRNRSVSGTFTGTRGEVSFSLPAVVRGAGEVLGGWATSFDLPMVEWQPVAWLGLLPAAAAVGGVLIRRQWRRPSDWLPGYVFGGFALIYLTAFVITPRLATSAEVAASSLAPLYVPLVVTAAWTLDRLLGRAAPRAVAGVATAALCLWTAGQIEPNAREIRRANAEGAYGYASPFWAPSETLQWIRGNQMEGRILSNEAMVVSFHNYASAIPGEAYRHLPGVAEDMVALLQGWRAEGVTYYVVWFAGEWFNRHLDYGVAALRAAPELELVAELADGAVFKSAPAAD